MPESARKPNLLTLYSDFLIFMDWIMAIKIFAVVALIGIVLSLLSGMIFLVTDKGQTDRTAKALTLRIVLSVVLFGVLMLAITTGKLQPHGIYPSGHPVTEKAPGQN